MISELIMGPLDYLCHTVLINMLVYRIMYNHYVPIENRPYILLKWAIYQQLCEETAKQAKCGGLLSLMEVCSLITQDRGVLSKPQQLVRKLGLGVRITLS